MNGPTPQLPLILTFPADGRRSIPSLKNNRVLIRDEDDKTKSIKNRRVMNYLRTVGPVITEQWQRQADAYGWSILPVPIRVSVILRLVMYRRDPLKLGKSDEDNIYTTTQEMLQGLVLEDDRQVIEHHVRTQYTTNRALHHAKMFLWVSKSEDEAVMEQAYRYVVDHHVFQPEPMRIVGMPSAPNMG